MAQVPLAFKTKEVDYAEENYFTSECNQEALQYIKLWPKWNAHAVLLYGPEGSGKTHLAHIWQQASEAEFVDLDNFNAPLLRQTEAHFIVEDVSRQVNQEALLHLFNFTREQEGYLLITSKVHPKRLSLTLPDLNSRLNAIPSISISQPDDKILKLVLLKHLSDRQLRVNASVLDYIVARMERSFGAVRDVVRALDQFSMEQKRNITIPFAKQVLQKLED